jgi:hypothetical protein
MTENQRQRFAKAYDAWRSEPVEHIEASATLWNVSQSLTHTQELVAPILHAYYQRAAITPAPLGMNRWHDGMSYLIVSDMRTLRRMQQQGRQQVQTRALLKRAEKLKAVWDAYRSAVGL